MPRRTASVFVAKPKTAAMSFHVSEPLQQRVKAVQTKLKETDDDAVFPLDRIVEDALTRAVDLAERELSARPGNTKAAARAQPSA